MKRRYKTRRNVFFLKAYRFLRKYKKAVLICICVAALVLVFFFVIKPFIIDKNMTPPPKEQPAPEETNEVIDDATLAGLIGEQGALNAGEGEFASEGIKVGVTMTSLEEQDMTALIGLEKQAAKAIEEKQITDFYVYDASGDENQQIQDVFSMINSGVRTLIIVNTTEYNFAKILDIAANNGVKCITYNMGQKEGVEANIVEQENSAADFANFIKSASQTQTYVTSGSKEQISVINAIVPVTQSYGELSESVDAVTTSIEEQKVINSMICFGNSPNDLLKSWLEKGVYPKAFASYATVDIIKSWYLLLNEGVEIVNEIDTPAVEDEVAASQEAQLNTATTLNAAPTDFAGFALTKTENTGDILFEFALNIAEGKKLPEANYLYEITAAEKITNENIAQYYEKVKDLPSGFVYSNADVSKIAELFQ